MRQKMELIQEIRAMEATSAARQPKTVDLTETAGYGLLCEMSIAEVSYVNRVFVECLWNDRSSCCSAKALTM